MRERSWPEDEAQPRSVQRSHIAMGGMTEVRTDLAGESGASRARARERPCELSKLVVSAGGVAASARAHHFGGGESRRGGEREVRSRGKKRGSRRARRSTKASGVKSKSRREREGRRVDEGEQSLASNFDAVCRTQTRRDARSHVGSTRSGSVLPSLGVEGAGGPTRQGGHSVDSTPQERSWTC